MNVNQGKAFLHTIACLMVSMKAKCLQDQALDSCGFFLANTYVHDASICQKLMSFKGVQPRMDPIHMVNATDLKHLDKTYTGNMFKFL